ncbi:MAG: DUF2169 domain-containing protein, partial [Polyangiaceae bacterium]|nr:DUF2169 domain-containing protein [Polyangiaceae bacterium]
MRPPTIRGDIPGSSLVYGPGGGRIKCSIVCKATFRLMPGKLELAQAQEAIFEGDSYWDDDTGRSLSAATDLTPLKPKIDVLLVGHAFAV